MRSSILGDHGSILLTDDKGWNSADSILLLELVGHGRVVLTGQPVAVGLLHVGQHVLGGTVRGDEHDLHAGLVHLVVEVLEHRGELAAGRTPVGGEVVQNQFGAGQSVISGYGGAVGLDQSGAGETVPV